MKHQEKTSSMVKPQYVRETDGDKVSKYGPEFDPNNWLLVDLELLNLTRVVDLYHNETALYKELRPGEGTGSPYNDCTVKMKVRIEVDGQIVFSHDEPLEIKEDTPHAEWDLELYQLPALVRKMLKKQK